MEEVGDGTHDHKMIPEMVWADDRIASVLAACIWCEAKDPWPVVNNVCSFVNEDKTSEHWPVCAEVCHFHSCIDIQAVVKDHFRTELKLREEDLMEYVTRFVAPLCYACPIGEAACVSNPHITGSRHNVNALVDHYVDMLSAPGQTTEQIAEEKSELQNLLGQQQAAENQVVDSSNDTTAVREKYNAELRQIEGLRIDDTDYAGSFGPSDGSSVSSPESQQQTQQQFLTAEEDAADVHGQAGALIMAAKEEQALAAKAHGGSSGGNGGGRVAFAVGAALGIVGAALALVQLRRRAAGAVTGPLAAEEMEAGTMGLVLSSDV
jgi:hypothetical protein